MSVNPTITYLDNSQIVKRVYDESNDAVRVIVGTGTTFEIALDAASGDSVKIVADNTASETATLTSTSSGVVIASASATGIKSFQLYGKVTATAGASTAGNIIARIDLSPDSGTTWFSTANTLTIPSTSTTGTVVQGSILTALSTNVRVSLTTNALAVGDTVKFYLISNGT